MTGRFEGKVALITGGGSGMGRSCALAFAEEGADVCVVGRTAEKGLETVDLIRRAGRDAIFVEADVGQADDVKRMVAETVAKYGRMDFAVNNAASPSPGSIPLAEMDEQVWSKVLATNLTGVFLCLQHQIRHMLTQGGGSIVNVASVAGVRGFPNASAYVASKHGVVGLTKSAALDYAEQGIRVNVLCPGTFLTPMLEHYMAASPANRARVKNATPMGRPGNPDEMVGAVLWLCSDQASYVTGATISVDGGWTAA